MNDLNKGAEYWGGGGGGGGGTRGVIKGSKTLPLWNLYFHSSAVNTTSIVIQG